MWFTSLIFAGAAALSQPLETDQQDTQPPEDERSLEEVVTTGSVLNPELDPQTGKLIIHPVMLPRGGNSPPSAFSVDLFFAPVVEVDGNVASLYAEQERERYRVHVSIPQTNSSGTRIHLASGKPLSLGEQSIDLPGGTYVLSEIRYVLRDIGAGNNFATASGPSLLNLNDGQSVRSYCLSKETYAFDIQNGKNQYFGVLALTAIPTNRGRQKYIFPVTGLDQRSKHLSPSIQRDLTEIEPLDWDLLSLDPRDDICQTDPRFDVAALAPERP